MCFLKASTAPNFVLHEYNLLGVNVITSPQVKSIAKHSSNASQQWNFHLFPFVVDVKSNTNISQPCGFLLNA
jgi:hypothetical protein